MKNFFFPLLRYEFWPPWIFYLPLVPYLLYLSLKYRGLNLISIVNPAIPLGGIVGESKYQILQHLPGSYVLENYLIKKNKVEIQKKQIEMIAKRLGYPVVLKPDASQRGASVKIIHSKKEILPYLFKVQTDILIQKFHPGPYEIGIFYYRYPDQEKGKIFSITGKEFPVIEGDGISTLKTLILKHPRYRYQYPIFFQRWKYRLNEVLKQGETLILSEIGNHCQGTQFIDRSDLITQALEETIDAIAKCFQGFYFGRFDIRYSNETDLKKGKNFFIIELNGATSESTNLYDPDFSIMKAYRILFQQWKILYKIASINRKKYTPIPVFTILKEIYHYYRRRKFPLVGDWQ